MITSTVGSAGRLGNQMIRNLAVHLIAKKNDLYVNYGYKDVIEKMGIELFCGNKIYNNNLLLTDENYLSIYNLNVLENNLYPSNFYQTKEICHLIHNYLHTSDVKSNIITKNPFNTRYNTNNDLFVHVRLDDAVKWNPGINYYIDTIDKIHYNDLYISTDEINHHFIKELFIKFPNAKLVQYDEITTFQFASTCKNIILSNGSFSAVIGYLSFFSNVYYPEYQSDKMWHGDMFSIEGWNKCTLNV